MADAPSVAGPSQPKKRKVNKILTDAEMLELLQNSDLSDYDSTDEDYGWESSDASDGESDVAMDTREMSDSDVAIDTREMSDSETEDNDASPQLPTDGKISFDWETDSNSMVSHPFMKTESLLIQPSECTPFVYFRLFLTDDILQKIVEETNHYAQEILSSDKTKEKSRITFWKNLQIDEFLVFLGVFLQTGNIKTNRLQDYWKKDPLFHNAGIANSISRNRFLLIFTCIAFCKK